MNPIRAELARRELARRDLLPFIQYMKPEYHVGWFHRKLTEVLDAFVEAVNRKGSPRIILSVAPRVGKSTAVSEYLPAYILGKQPKAEIIAATYNQELANAFGRKVRDILQNPAYQDLYSCELDPNAQAINYVRLASGGSYYAVGAGGSLTGRGTNALIIDDPVKDREQADSPIESEKLWEWYSSTARTRLHPGGGIICVMTRWAVDDLAGRLIDQANRDPAADQWTIINFPALADEDEEFRKKGEALHPERYDREAYLRIKASIDPRDWASLYCGKPYLDGGNFFSADTVRYYTQKPDDLTWLIGADYATSASKKSDKSAMVPLGIDHAGNVYIGEDFFYDRVDPWDAVVRTISLGKQYNARDLAGEAGPIQNTMGPIFARVQDDQKWYMTVSKNVRRSSKAIAANTMKALMFNGKLHFPDTPRIRNEIIPELLAFDPKVDRGGDDFLDACFSGETRVLTDQGWVRIDCIVRGDHVLTRNGFCKVTKAWCKGYRSTRPYAGVYATPEHLCYTVNRGWVRLDALSNTDTVVGCKNSPESKLSYFKDASIAGIQTPNKARTAAITRPPAGARCLDSFTVTFGKAYTALSRQDTTFITKTETASTTVSTTLYVSRQSSTTESTQKTSVGGQKHQSTWPTLPTFDISQKPGTALTKAVHGIENTRKRPARCCENVSIVAYKWSCLSPPDGAHRVSAEKSTGKPPPTREKNVPVYDLNVSKHHEFFVLTENGPLLVHNCVNGCVLIESIGRPLPPVAPPPKWRTEVGAVYGADVFKTKKREPKIPGLSGNW